jgi:hypothetical protein
MGAGQEKLDSYRRASTPQAHIHDFIMRRKMWVPGLKVFAMNCTVRKLERHGLAGLLLARKDQRQMKFRSHKDHIYRKRKLVQALFLFFEKHSINVDTYIRISTYQNTEPAYL